MSINNIVRVLQAGGTCSQTGDPPDCGRVKTALLSTPDTKRLLQRATACNGGNRGWRGWKAAEATRLVEMVDRAPRMTLLELDLQGEFNAVYRIEMPVPLTPSGGTLRIGNQAVFHLRYDEAWRWESPEGWEPLGLLHPNDPFHPNARPSLRGAICLGDLPPGTQPTEMVLLGYFTLSLQDVMLNEADPNGVMNSKACDFFREHSQYVPLTDAGLFDPLESET